MLLHSAVEAFQIRLEYFVPADVFQLEVLQWKEALGRLGFCLLPFNKQDSVDRAATF